MNNISNKKIFLIANKFSSSIPDDLNPDEVFNQIRLKQNSQMKEYFYMLGPHTFLKVAIAIWAFKSGKSENDVINIYNKLFFTILLSNTDDSFTPDCSECDGTGDNDCDFCNRGNETCPDCDGDGGETCGDCSGTAGDIFYEDCECCDGTGETEDEETCSCCGGDGKESHVRECRTCDNSGQITCETCGGDGEVNCNHCDGYGYHSCKSCNRQGYQISEEKYAEVLLVCSWDKRLFELCELNEGINKPILDDSELIQINDKIVLNSNLDFHFPFMSDVEAFDVYCVKLLDDYPKLILKPNLSYVNTMFDENDASYLMV
jgi:hypothetical protein